MKNKKDHVSLVKTPLLTALTDIKTHIILTCYHLKTMCVIKIALF